MKLALLGYPIQHSMSPELYRKILGDKLTSYELLSISDAGKIPKLQDLASRLDGLNITTPYKEHFIHSVEVENETLKSLGAINTIAFGTKIIATNTDYDAVKEILQRFIDQFPKLNILMLGDGVMARVTLLVARELGISLRQFSRRLNGNIELIDLMAFELPDYQTLVINTCSRHYVFRGNLSRKAIFWDYNYSYLPHSSSLPARLKYIDGLEMLQLQAIAAVRFWERNKP